MPGRPQLRPGRHVREAQRRARGRVGAPSGAVWRGRPGEADGAPRLQEAEGRPDAAAPSEAAAGGRDVTRSGARGAGAGRGAVPTSAGCTGPGSSGSAGRALLAALPHAGTLAAGAATLRDHAHSVRPEPCWKSHVGAEGRRSRPGRHAGSADAETGCAASTVPRRRPVWEARPPPQHPSARGTQGRGRVRTGGSLRRERGTLAPRSARTLATRPMSSMVARSCGNCAKVFSTAAMAASTCPAPCGRPRGK